MGTPKGKKNAPKKGQTAAHNRRSPSKALKADQAPQVEKLKTPAVAKETTYTHMLPTDEQKKNNGRVVGRSLIMWNRPRMAEKLLLHVHYECARHNVNLPWNAIAHRLRPGSSSQAILQYFNRLRKELLIEGHLVPPVAHKTSPPTPYDPTIRGYIRDPTVEDQVVTRSVGYGEKLGDAKTNLPSSLALLEKERREREEEEGDFFSEADADPFTETDADMFAEADADMFAEADADMFAEADADMFAEADVDFFAEANADFFDEANADFFAEADADFAALDAEMQIPESPTPVRHAAPRRPVSTPHFSMEPQNLEQGKEEATQQLFDPSLFAGISPPDFFLNSVDAFQPMGIQAPAAFTNQAQLMTGAGGLFDPFAPQTLINPSHGQISPAGQLPFAQVQQPLFMGNPYNNQFTGYYNLNQTGFMPQPSYGFTMPPTPPNFFNTEQKVDFLSAQNAIQDKGISSSPVSSPMAAQVPAFRAETVQAVVESPELQFGASPDAPRYSDEFVGDDGLLQFLAAAQ